LGGIYYTAKETNETFFRKMRKIIRLPLIYFLLLFVKNVSAVEYRDTTGLSYELEEVIVAGAYSKEAASLPQRPVAGTLVSALDLEKQDINSLKELSAFAPNFYIPDYGSKMTSSIYIRGIGSRIDQPAVGLYIDGIPVLNKNLFDFDFYDIRFIEILRGPQGTLYGRNTIAGIVNIKTVSPELNRKYTNLYASYGNYNDLKLQAAHYNHIGKVAFSVNGYYKQNDGFFTNQYTGKKVDNSQSAGGRAAVKWEEGAFSLYNVLNYDYLKQGGYPYAQLDTAGKTLPVNYNDYCGYRRNIISDGLLLKWQLPNIEISSATGYQYLNDQMDMDQDFTEKSVFIMTQKQQEHAFTEEILVKPIPSGKNYKWLFGLSGFYKSLRVQAPVTFKEDGIAGLIEGNVNKIFQTSEKLQSMDMNLDILDNSFLIVNDFNYPSLGAAFFHQSTYENLFIRGLSLTGGLRFDYENARLDYESSSNITHRFSMTIPPSGFPLSLKREVETFLKGAESNNFYQILPKIALKYDIDLHNNVYISVTKGYKTGGFNTQMFADVLQKAMQDDMKEDLYNQIPDFVSIKGDLAEILLPQNELNIKDVIAYAPEYSWNYEIGGHFSFLQKKLYADVALFYIDCRDQQLTVFSTYGMGRMMRNAGRTESFGIESSVRARTIENLWLNGAYGYTHAVFKEYNDGENDYAGNFVPFAPQNTFSIGGDYTLPVRHRLLDRITLQAQYSGVGRIYWTEKNDVYQDFYGTLNGSLSFQKRQFKLEVWAKNMLNTAYNTFYFESMGNRFLQKVKPFQIGVGLKILFE
jgi:outer membrane receptor protein involved in Fe transport